MLAALIVLPFLQSGVLQDLTECVHALGRLVGSAFLQRVELIQSLELIFGIILVLMMLFRREGLIPAVRRGVRAHAASSRPRRRRAAPPCSCRGRAPADAERSRAAAAGDRRAVQVRFGGLAAADDIDLTVPRRRAWSA